MKSLALFAALFACACASSPTAVIDKHAYQCGQPGLDVEIEAGIDDGTGAGGSEMTGMREFLVRVTNNAHGELTVKTVRVDPNMQNSAGIDPVAKEFDHTIDENDEFIFHLPVDGPWRHGGFSPRSAAQRLEFSVTVVLTNGDSYRCQFESAVQ